MSIMVVSRNIATKLELAKECKAFIDNGTYNLHQYAAKMKIGYRSLSQWMSKIEEYEAHVLKGLGAKRRKPGGGRRPAVKGFEVALLKWIKSEQDEGREVTVRAAIRMAEKIAPGYVGVHKSYSEKFRLMSRFFAENKIGRVEAPMVVPSHIEQVAHQAEELQRLRKKVIVSKKKLHGVVREGTANHERLKEELELSKKETLQLAGDVVSVREELQEKLLQLQEKTEERNLMLEKLELSSNNTVKERATVRLLREQLECSKKEALQAIKTVEILRGELELCHKKTLRESATVKSLRQQLGHVEEHKSENEKLKKEVLELTNNNSLRDSATMERLRNELVICRKERLDERETVEMLREQIGKMEGQTSENERLKKELLELREKATLEKSADGALLKKRLK